MTNEICKYHDGEKERFGDPWRIERLLDAHAGGDFDALIDQTKSPNTDISCPAFDQLYTAIRVAFDLKPFDATTGQGATEEFCHDLYKKFRDWQDKKKANTETPPTTQQPMVGTPPSPPAASPPMPNQQKSSMASTST